MSEGYKYFKIFHVNLIYHWQMCICNYNSLSVHHSHVFHATKLSMCSNWSLTQPELRLCLKHSILPLSSLLASFPHPSTSLSSCWLWTRTPQTASCGDGFVSGWYYPFQNIPVPGHSVHIGDPKLLHYNSKSPRIRTWQPKMPNRVNLKEEQRPQEIAGLMNYKIGCDTGKGGN